MKEIQELIDKAEKGYDGVITNVEKTTSKEFFGESKYDDRNGYSVELKLVDDPDYVWTEFFNIPSPLGIKESKIYKFSQKYGELPKKGLKVKVELIEGFLRISL